MNTKYIEALRVAAAEYLWLQDGPTRGLDTYQRPPGLCAYVEDEMDAAGVSACYQMDVQAACARITRYWPHYSGEQGFPVPGPRHYVPCEAYRSLPKYSGTYGHLRKDLAGYLGRRLLELALCIEAGGDIETYLNATEHKGNNHAWNY